ncbi:uncharacterized protein LOC130675158 [Microplitis mediator]|uniref:uncharacterized protein LOC130675158 n=1 Tax=Microplitis mediator TaxID=375433 RepID=UPI00255519C5|nr:uncharacterized protein LOC130675158 [Microplitis mediator]
MEDNIETMVTCMKYLSSQECLAYMKYETLSQLSQDEIDIVNRLKQNLESTKISQVDQRMTRAPWFGFIGKAAREVFDLMDMDDQEHISKEIDRLFKDQAEITHLIRENTHIIKAEINRILSHQNIRGIIRSVLVRPRTKFLAVDSGTDHYSFAEEDFIKSCKGIADELTCRPDLAIHKIGDTLDCEPRLFTRPSLNVMESCDVRIFPTCETQFVKLHQANTWLYSICEQEKMTLKCGRNIRLEYTLNSSGLLSLSPGCSLENKFLYIKRVEEEITRSINASFPKINWQKHNDGFTTDDNAANISTVIEKLQMDESSLQSQWGDSLKGSIYRIKGIRMHR